MCLKHLKKVTYLFAIFVRFLCFFVSKNKKDSIFMCIKTFKKKKIACLTFCVFYVFCVFYAFYTHLSKSCLFLFCSFLRFLCLFVLISGYLYFLCPSKWKLLVSVCAYLCLFVLICAYLVLVWCFLCFLWFLCFLCFLCTSK